MNLRDEEADDAPDVEDVNEEAQPAVGDGLRVVGAGLGAREEGLPAVDLLRRVDEHAVVARRHAAEDQDHGPGVQLSQVRLPRPRDLLEPRPLDERDVDLLRFRGLAASRPHRLVGHHCRCRVLIFASLLVCLPV